MADDLYNNSGGTTGNQILHRITVKQQARGGSYITKTYSPDNEKTVDVSTIKDKYDNRFDDPNYYG